MVEKIWTRSSFYFNVKGLYLLAHIFHGVWQVAENLVLLRVHALTLCVHPPAALGALHHPRFVVVIVVATLTQRAVRALLLLQAAGGTERGPCQVVGDVGLATGGTAQTMETHLDKIRERRTVKGSF